MGDAGGADDVDNSVTGSVVSPELAMLVLIACVILVGITLLLAATLAYGIVLNRRQSVGTMGKWCHYFDTCVYQGSLCDNKM